MGNFIIFFFWMIMALLLIEQWIKPLRTVSWGLKIFIFFLIVATAPLLIVSNVVMGFLDCVFPEGWDE